MTRLKIIVDDGNVYSLKAKVTESERDSYTLARHRILINNWSFEYLTKIALYDMQRTRSLYKTANGQKPDMIKALWQPYYPHDDLETQPWNKKFKSNIPEKDMLSFYLVCNIKYETYWLVKGIEYNNYNDAFEALYNELFIIPAVPMLIAELAERRVL